ncbi:MAG: nicotinate-nucleotide adenylyltransferase [Enterocloster sp.]
MAKIGILGGTFDPVHIGHLSLGEQAQRQFELEQIWFMPSGIPPHKKDHRVTDGIHRLRMVNLAIRENPRFICSDFELKRDGNTYTAKTLRLLREEYPEHTFYFIIGADSLYQIERWYHPELVMEQTVLLVAGRAYEEEHLPLEEQIQYLQDKYNARIFPIAFEEIDISSEEIRNTAAAGGSISRWVPEAVENYIVTHGLYRSVRRPMSSKGE